MFDLTTEQKMHRIFIRNILKIKTNVVKRKKDNLSVRLTGLRLTEQFLPNQNLQREIERYSTNSLCGNLIDEIPHDCQTETIAHLARRGPAQNHTTSVEVDWKNVSRSHSTKRLGSIVRNPLKINKGKINDIEGYATSILAIFLQFRNFKNQNFIVYCAVSTESQRSLTSVARKFMICIDSNIIREFIKSASHQNKFGKESNEKKPCHLLQARPNDS